MPPKEKYKDFESAIQRLEEITDKLESGEESLENSIKLYTEGLEIAKFCQEKLTAAESKVKIIREQEGVMTEEDFASDEGKE